MIRRSTPAMLSCVLLLLAVACAGSRAPADRDWSRSYFKTYERVWDAAKQTLADQGYYVKDSDKDGGRIRALSEADRSFEELVLDIRIIERAEDVRVDVQVTGGGGTQSGFKRMQVTVMEYLDDLDARLGR
jgi:hypothetical protein